jgi:opacity protein-like surface antigen
MMRSKVWPILLSFFFVFLVQLDFAHDAGAEEAEVEKIPTKFGWAVMTGNTYASEEDLSYQLGSVFALFDYDRVWPHPAPEGLRFKVELNVGSTWRNRFRFMTSVAMLALYYVDFLRTDTFQPYIEGGIGAIYTDFRLEDQGTRINFFPQIGVGTDISIQDGPTFFTTFRLQHLSNGGLHEENRGINGAAVVFGMYF